MENASLSHFVQMYSIALCWCSIVVSAELALLRTTKTTPVMPDIFPEVRKMTDSLLTIPFDENDKINEAEKIGTFDGKNSMCLYLYLRDNSTHNS